MSRALGMAADECAGLFKALQDMGAGEFQHLNGTLEAHLRGTHALLREWGAPTHVCTAGLYHAAYGTAGFDEAMASLAQRPAIAHLMGTDAERLVYLYGCCDRARYYPSVGSPSDRYMPNRWSGGMEELSHEDQKGLFELTVANELEIALHGEAFRHQHGAALADLFQRMATHLSEEALAAARRILGQIDH